MDVLVVVDFAAVTETEFILRAAVTVFEHMHEMVLPEEHERAVDARLVDGENGLLQFFERQRTVRRGQSLGDDDAIGRGFHAVSAQQLDSL